MPLIPPKWMDCVFYIYDSIVEAKSSEMEGGGTGFFVGVKPSTMPGAFMYGVTNWHVVKDVEKPAIRINMKSGGFDVLETRRESWIKHSSEDLAVIPLKAEYDKYNIVHINVEEWLITTRDMEEFKYGPGDEVILIGRFINQDGKAKNSPIARFGNIARNPNEESQDFLVELRAQSADIVGLQFLYGQSPFKWQKKLAGTKPRQGGCLVLTPHTFPRRNQSW